MAYLSDIKTYLARISIVFFLIILMWGCGRVPSVTESTAPVSRLPFVKVLLENSGRQHTISISDDGEMAIDCYKGNKRVSYFSRRPVVIAGEKNTLALYDQTGNNLDYNIDRIILSARGKNKYLTYDNHIYRGLFEMESISGQVGLVNVVYIEDYLQGVVPLEIGPTPEEQYEAIKAQAVAARTYAMAHLGQYGDRGYDLKADITDQVYQGVTVENKLVNSAVKDTRGIVAVYHGEMIDAYYHSTCGGKTDDIEDVWDKDPKPYLRSVSDSNACSISKYFTWTERFSDDQIILRLERYLSQSRGRDVSLGKLTDISITARTPGGRIASIIFETTSGHFIFDKEEVRWVLRRSDDLDAIMRSANFDIDVLRYGDGNVREVIFNGRGYGHGVGMCQMGARGLAAQGVTYDSILSLYYQGINLKQLY